MKHLSILIFLLLFTLPFGVLAQTDDSPLFMIIDNQLWSWTPDDAAPQRVTDRPSVDDMVVSPDGTQLAFVGMADLTVEAIQRTGGFGGGGTPTDIWLLDIATGRIRHIAQQPPDASLMIQGVEDKGVSRSVPVWSPDGTRLSWAELVLPNLDHQIVIYNVASNTIETTITDIPPQVGVPAPLELTWGEPGILYRSWSLNADGVQEDALVLHAPDGSLISSILLDNSTRRVIDYLWVRIDEQEFIGIRYNDDQWEVMSPYTGSSQPLVEPPQAYSRLAPDALSLTFQGIEVEDWMWSAVSSAGSSVLQGNGNSPSRITLSPSGQAVAFNDYLTQDRVYENIVQVWRDGQTLTVPEAPSQRFIMHLVWGPIAWRAEQDVSELLTGTACPGFLPSRLSIGGQARVLGNTPNNVRSEPNAGSQRLGQIPGGAVFTIVDGPVCADDLAWWQVDYEGLVGWTAEGQESTYWLEPVR